ncbi:MAG: hypothetical protein EBR82_06965 [Caulobacteraceae bacterium]|nr:hypothetical protein [Caulobacteraceae bacterium]
MTYLLPTTPITNEAEALKAARASAIAIFIGVVVGIIGAIWTLMNPQFAEAVAAAQAQMQGGNTEAASMSAGGAKVGEYVGYALLVVSAVFGIVQWKKPAKWIAILFMVLIVLFGLLPTACAQVLSGMVPGMPSAPVWLTALSVVSLIVQFILHITGLKGISRLDKIQLDAANAGY